MAQKISVDDLRHNISIKDTISYYIKDIKKFGDTYKCICPFHPETIPSMVINEKKGLFHCFGCGTGGDAISFIMKYKHISFMGAVKELAYINGYELETTKHSNHVTNEQILNSSLSFFTLNLLKDKKAKDYLSHRGFEEAILNEFKIGYAEDIKDALYVHIHSLYENMSKYSYGVFGKNGDGLIDFFRDRVMIPIYDDVNNLVGFAGRSLKPDCPKYINSPESAKFSKRKILFNLHKAKNYIKDSIILVEGYFDVIKCFSVDVKNVVATMGTSLTIDHINLIKQYASNVILMMDGDAAGISSMLKDIDMLMSKGLSVFVIIIPEGLDPEDYILKYGEKKFKELFNTKIDGISFKINETQKKYNTNIPYQRKQFVDNVLRFIKDVNNISIEDLCIKKLSEVLDTDEHKILKYYRTEYKKDKKNKENLIQQKKKYNKIDTIKKNIISSLLNDIQGISICRSFHISMETFSNVFHRKIYSLLENVFDEKITDLWQHLKVSVDDTEYSLLQDEYINPEVMSLMESIYFLNIENLTTDIQHKKEEINKCIDSGNCLMINDYYKELTELLLLKHKYMGAGTLKFSQPV